MHPHVPKTAEGCDSYVEEAASFYVSTCEQFLQNKAPVIPSEREVHAVLPAHEDIDEMNRNIPLHPQFYTDRYGTDFMALRRFRLCLGCVGEGLLTFAARHMHLWGSILAPRHTAGQGQVTWAWRAMERRLVYYRLLRQTCRPYRLLFFRLPPSSDNGDRPYQYLHQLAVSFATAVAFRLLLRGCC